MYQLIYTGTNTDDFPEIIVTTHASLAQARAEMIKDVVRYATTLDEYNPNADIAEQVLTKDKIIIGKDFASIDIGMNADWQLKRWQIFQVSDWCWYRYTREKDNGDWSFSFVFDN